MMRKSYNDLIKIQSFEDRIRYLQERSKVCDETFGFDRYLNQIFYSSKEWRSLRDSIIIRDNGCDLGVDGMPIFGKIYIHHINPITVDDIKNRSDSLLDPNNLISMSYDTHQLVHYGSEIAEKYTERKSGDTCPWKVTANGQ